MNNPFYKKIEYKSKNINPAAFFCRSTCRNPLLSRIGRIRKGRVPFSSCIKTRGSAISRKACVPRKIRGKKAVVCVLARFAKYLLAVSMFFYLRLSCCKGTAAAVPAGFFREGRRFLIPDAGNTSTSLCSHTVIKAGGRIYRYAYGSRQATNRNNREAETTGKLLPAVPHAGFKTA